MKLVASMENNQSDQFPKGQVSQLVYEAYRTEADIASSFVMVKQLTTAIESGYLAVDLLDKLKDGPKDPYSLRITSIAVNNIGRRLGFSTESFSNLSLESSGSITDTILNVIKRILVAIKEAIQRAFAPIIFTIHRIISLFDKHKGDKVAKEMEKNIKYISSNAKAFKSTRVSRYFGVNGKVTADDIMKAYGNEETFVNIVDYFLVTYEQMLNKIKASLSHNAAINSSDYDVSNIILKQINGTFISERNGRLIGHHVVSIDIQGDSENQTVAVQMEQSKDSSAITDIEAEVDASVMKNLASIVATHKRVVDKINALLKKIMNEQHRIETEIQKIVDETYKVKDDGKLDSGGLKTALRAVNVYGNFTLSLINLYSRHTAVFVPATTILYEEIHKATSEK